MIKILIVEDQTMLRQSLDNLLNAQDDIEVIGGTDDASKAPELCKKLKPDIILMDVMTKNDSNGIRYTAEIRKEFPEIKVVIMTGLPEITFADEARKAGAHSFIYKDMDNEHLLYVIRRTIKGMNIYSGSDECQPFANRFTEREIKIIRMICQGIKRDSIAKKLEISESLVKHQITSILDKSGFDTIGEFAIYAVSKGLIVPNL